MKIKKLLFETATKANAGDVSEGILGAACTARFLYGSEKPITQKEIWTVIEQLNKTTNKSTGSTVLKSKTFSKPPTVKPGQPNSITLTVGLSENNYAGFIDPVFFQSIDGIVRAAAAFASSPSFIRLVKNVEMSAKANKIEISSVGLEDQKGTKVDLKIAVDGKVVPLGALSLKAGGTKQVGQIGKGWAASKPGASRGIVDLFRALFGVEINKNLQKQYEQALSSANYVAISQAIDEVYYDCFKQVSKKFDSGVNEISDFIIGLAKAIKYEAMLEEEGVILVHLDAGNFKALDFGKFVSLANDEQVEMDVEIQYQPPASYENSVPFLFVNLKVDGQDFGKLISIRPKIRVEEGVKVKEFKHYVQKESGLAKLLSIDLD